MKTELNEFDFELIPVDEGSELEAREVPNDCSCSYRCSYRYICDR